LWGEAGNLPTQFTVKGTLLERVPPALAGTVVLIRELETAVNAAGVPLSVTLVVLAERFPVS
jgi:hypothetical protein